MSSPDRITYFASTDARGKSVPFGIKEKDRAKHVYIIGKTGMGKSTLLENMAIQDIQSGQGLAFIDPHGGTAETLLDYVPEERIDDVLYFAPFDTDTPVAFNVMEDIGADKRHLVVSGLMATFKKIWVDAWSGRMEYILSNTILALLEFPGSTLLGVNRMLSDSDYRDLVVSNVKDASVRAFWVDEFANYNERYMQEAGDAIKNKVGQFTSNPLIRNIIGQPKSSFNIREMMDQKKILIMNLSKGRVGETNMALLGSMITTRIYIAAMSRADLTGSALAKLPNFFFFVDEFQNFANDTFSDILSEARKYKLNLTIAHQYVEQMDEDVSAAVFGNVGTTIAFRVGPFDAEKLETIFMPKFMKEDLVNLGFAQVYLTLQIDGVGSPPFSARTMPRIEMPRISQKDRVIAHSKEQFGRPRAVSEKEILDWYKPVTPPEGFTLVKGGAVKKKRPMGSMSSNGQPFAASSTYRPPAVARPGGDMRSNPPRPSSEQRVEGPVTTQEQVPPEVQRRERREPSLGDLRATLKSISEPKTQQPKAPPQQRSGGLKDALANVINQEVRKNPEFKPAKPVEEVKKDVPKQSVPEEVLRKLLTDSES
jgi:energy-coupling factor transporter ATP-binding protein EcfA2